jgi:DNA-binding CsgD family transcriptional regulator
MGRLLPFLQLAFAVCATAFFGIWGAVPARLAAVPLLVVVLCPLLAACAVWPLDSVRRAFFDGWGSDPLRQTRPGSIAVWRIMERTALPAGLLGAVLFAILALGAIGTSGIQNDPQAQTRASLAMAGLSCCEAAGVFLLFRVVRMTVDLLQSRHEAVIPREISEAAAGRFSLSPREREVAGLLMEGLRYDEIADRLFISMKTVKSHVHHLYEKTETRNRMELANRLRA